MANPVVATNVLSASIHKLKKRIQISEQKFLQTIRDTGQPEPTDEDDAIAFEGSSLYVNNSTGVDVWLKAKNKNGQVRVES